MYDYKVTSHFKITNYKKELSSIWVILVLLVQYQPMSSDSGGITFLSFPLCAFVTFWVKDMND